LEILKTVVLIKTQFKITAYTISDHKLSQVLGGKLDTLPLITDHRNAFSLSSIIVKKVFGGYL